MSVHYIQEARLARQRRDAQLEVARELETPDSEEAAADIAVVATTEDFQDVIGIGMYPPSNGVAWLLTPDQADALALSLVRCAAAARLRDFTNVD